MSILEQFREEENKRNLIARTYEEAEKEFQRVNRLQINVQLLSDGVELDDSKYMELVTKQVEILHKHILDKTEKELKDAERELKKILGLWKPATINQDFEDAVQGMIESAKTPKVPEDAKEPELPFVEVPDAPKTNEMDDSVELDISQGNPPETQNTEPKIEKPWLNEALLRKELVENGLGVGEFAKKYDCKKSDVYNGKSKYGINTTTVQKTTPSRAKR